MNNKTNIEEDIKILKEKLKQWEPYKDIEFTTEIEKEISIENRAIENILADRERLEKENEEMNTKILSNAGIYQLGFKDGKKKNQVKANKYDALVEKIKDTIKKLKKHRDLSPFGVGKIEGLQELLPKEE